MVFKVAPISFELVIMKLRARVRLKSSLGKLESKFTVKNPIIELNNILDKIR